MNWYPCFTFVVLLLWLFSSPRDRIALRIVLIATIGSFVLTEGVTRHITAPWKLLFPGAVETATILCLLRWARNRTGLMQAGCLVVAWFAHIFCYFDVILGTDLVYSSYETVLGAVAVAQLVAFHDTISHNLRRLGRWLDTLRLRRAGDLRPAGVRSALLPDPRAPRL